MVLTQNGQFLGSTAIAFGERFFVRKFSDRRSSKSVLSHGIARMHILKNSVSSSLRRVYKQYGVNVE